METLVEHEDKGCKYPGCSKRRKENGKYGLCVWHEKLVEEVLWVLSKTQLKAVTKQEVPKIIVPGMGKIKWS